MAHVLQAYAHKDTVLPCFCYEQAMRQTVENWPQEQVTYANTRVYQNFVSVMTAQQRFHEIIFNERRSCHKLEEICCQAIFQHMRPPHQRNSVAFLQFMTRYRPQLQILARYDVTALITILDRQWWEGHDLIPFLYQITKFPVRAGIVFAPLINCAVPLHYFRMNPNFLLHTPIDPFYFLPLTFELTLDEYFDNTNISKNRVNAKLREHILAKCKRSP